MQVLNHVFAGAAKVNEVATIVERQVTNLTRLVDDLLDVARITSGKVSLQREPVPLAAIVGHAVEIRGPLLEAGRHTVVFSIKDAGIGLEGESLSHIFDMFAQSDPARGQSLGGLGIDLSLAKRFTEMHGGTIHVTSQGLGRGSEFVLTLPIVIAAQPAAKAEPAMIATAPHDAANLRILVVDDNRDGADMLQLMLELDGYIVFKAYDGQQAVDTVQQCQPHVVLMDIGLPDMDGYEATRIIRRNPGGSEAVIVALTGWGHEEVRRQAAEAGMNHHLVKPVNLDVLRGYLQERAALQRAA
jgi:CheY-like chemotaxis protein